MTDASSQPHGEASPSSGPADAEATEAAMADLARRLFDAARAGDTEMLTAYVDAGVPVDLAAASGDTLLMLASYHGHTDATAALLARGANPNQPNDKGQTPLAGAVFKGFVEVVDALVAAGADPDGGQPSARAAAQMFERQDLLARLDRP